METGITFPRYQKNLSVVHMAIVTASVAVTLLAQLFRYNRAESPWQLSDEGYYGVFFAFFALVQIGIYFVQRDLNKLAGQAGLMNKLEGYKKKKLLFWAYYESVTAVSAVVLFLGGGPFFLFICIMETLVLLVHMPTRNKIVRQLNLSTEEQAQIDNPDADLSKL